MLCIVSMGMSGVASAQSSVEVMKHQAAGDRNLPDGGWEASCVDTNGACTGHMSEPPTPGTDLLPVHHHHHSSGEVSHGVLPDEAGAAYSLMAVLVALHPGLFAPLRDRTPSIPHQPPRT